MKNYQENVKSNKRPLTYHGNSIRSQQRRRKLAKEDIEKNGQTLDQFFLKKDSEEEMSQTNNIESSEMTNNELENIYSLQKNEQYYDDLINDIERILNESSKIANGYKLRLKALQYYFQLLKRDYKKINAANSVADFLNKGPWFAKCIRNWAKSFIESGDISYKKRGENLRGSIIDDEDIQIKILSFLRKEKFNITISKFVEFVSNELFPGIGIENEITIR